MAKTNETDSRVPDQAPPPDDGEETGGTRRMDPELRVMAAMLRLLDELSWPARARVVSYLSDRYRNDLPVSDR